jgi:TetR/AcrR family transcriptional repressor of nem operon
MGQHQADVRQHILDTGRALVLGKGFTAMGLAEMLTAARVPKGSFYYYFDSKEQFGEAMLESYFTGYLESLDELIRMDGSPGRERFMRYWRRWMAIQQQGPCPGQCLVVKLGAEVSDLSEAMRAALHRGTDRIIDRLSACVAEGIADGSLPALDPAAIAQALYELWLGASLLTKVRRDPSALSVALATTETLLATNTPRR